MIETGSPVSSHSLLYDLSITSLPMSIFRAIGFGILIITLRLLLPDVFDSGKETAIAFLHGARVSADTASSIAASATTSLHPLSSAGTTQSLPPLSLPQTPSIPSY
jgi:hypothetical protein